jgi:outer membrane lipoprotein-sorting protein
MGSDLSFEDMMESHKLSEIYDVTIAGDEEIGDKICYILDLESDKEDAPYARQKLWVGKDDFISYRYEFYALSGRLMKSAEVLEVQKINNKNFPVKIKMTDELRKDSSTIFELRDLKLDVEIPDEIFSRKNLLE